MIFGRRKTWEDQYDEGYADRAEKADRRARRSTTWMHCVGIFAVIAVLLAAVWMVAGRIMVEKILTGLASPLGIVWLGLLLVVYFGFLFRQTMPAMIALVIWVVLTFFGNGFVANQLVYGLENEHLGFNANTMEPLDVLFLLGGGTTTTLQPLEELTSAGDRVVTTARLFHAGKVNSIVCSGKQWNRASPDDLDPSQEAARLLIALQVPADRISRIAGRNTAEEMVLIAAFIEQQELGDKKIGIITSAFHLNRATRLAKKNEIEAEMIPCDFRARHFIVGPDLLLPSARNLDLAAICCKEYLAGLIGR